MGRHVEWNGKKNTSQVAKPSTWEISVQFLNRGCIGGNDMIRVLVFRSTNAFCCYTSKIYIIYAC